MKDLPTLLMESFVVIVNQHREVKGLGQKEFAMKCWPESTPAAAAIRWQTMRTKSNTTQKPQKVLLSDVQRMATVLNVEPSYLIEEAMSHSQDIINKEEKKMEKMKKTKKEGVA